MNYERPIPTHTHPQKGILEEVQRKFLISNALLTKSLGGGASINKLLITYDGERVDYILKSPLEGRDVETEITYLDRLRAHAFPTPKYLRAHDGNSFVQINGTQYLIQYRLPGKNPTASEETNFQIGQLLGKLHTVPYEGLPQRTVWLRPTYLSEALGVMEKSKDKISRYVDFQNAYTTVSPTLNYNELPKGITHGDVSFSNSIILPETGEITFIDWEETNVQPCILDLAISILNCCYRDNDVLDKNLVSYLINGYQSQRVFTDKEKISLIPAIQYVCLIQSMWRTLNMLEHPELPSSSPSAFWDRKLSELQIVDVLP